jgi:hypothetical protein
MPRWIYRPSHPCANDNGLVEVRLLQDEPEPLGLYVISDEMEPTRHMADGKYFTSKAKFRENTKAHGCIELGNEIPTLTKPRQRIALSREQRREDIKRTIYELRNGIRRET